MPATPFPHLSIVHKARGSVKLEGGGGTDARIAANKLNRVTHAGFLTGKFSNLSIYWKQVRETREAEGYPKIKGGVPFVLQIPDEDDGVIEFLAERLGLEIVAEYEEGFLIVASEDLDFKKVLEHAKSFSQSGLGSALMASIIDVEVSTEKRIQMILSSELLVQWPFADDKVLTLDVSIEVFGFGFPARKDLPKGVTKAEKNAEFERRRRKHLEDWDGKRVDRESEIEELITRNGGKLIHNVDDSHIVDFPDSFSMRIEMSGRGFKDIIINYPNIFEVTQPEEIGNPISGTSDSSQSKSEKFILLPPPEGAPTVCVIDSGIHEKHPWLSAAIDSSISKCLVPGKPDDEVADYVKNGGHGTRVAGACLYPSDVPRRGFYAPLFKIINIRVLDENCGLLSGVFPAALLKTIVEYCEGLRKTRIYQHSIGSKYECRLTRMSVWAAMIDYLSYKKDILLVQAAGNLKGASHTPTRPGILNYLARGVSYPDYLYEDASRICNPAQSLQALTVGSISGAAFASEDKTSLAQRHEPSSFSRTGFGMWDSIKPEVVEIGGDYVIDQGPSPALSCHPDVCPELIRSNMRGGPLYSRDEVGTSFAAPKVSHIAGSLAALLPESSALLYRALIVNSARWPSWAEQLPVARRVNVVRSIGYGVPEYVRATENSTRRITLITKEPLLVKAKEGYIFGIPIPEALRPQGESFTVRIDVTLSYSAEPRRTRKSRRGYLGVWLDWKASKRGERFDTFKTRALTDFTGGDGLDSGNFSWTLGNKMKKDGVTDGVSRGNGTVQKDWVVTNSFDLPDVFGIVVRGHPGWDRHNQEASAKFELVVSFEAIGVEVPIYEEIRAAIEAEVRVDEVQV